MSGTELAYGATSWRGQAGQLPISLRVSAYAYQPTRISLRVAYGPTRCPVLSARMVLPAWYCWMTASEIRSGMRLRLMAYPCAPRSPVLTYGHATPGGTELGYAATLAAYAMICTELGYAATRDYGLAMLGEQNL
eukprot:3941384-Rhodomonas_salina.10